ncbi:MAG TPA: DUF4831 domain-containing protein [Porphyromonadaceae bacterium]|nr:DUF4831 domain-containing protein [Porphyromonadaceae bacterium]
MRAKSLIFPLLFLITSCATAQKTVRVNAIKANNYGVIYSLPKTSFEVELLVKKTTYKRGDFYPYAQRYLAVDNTVTEDRIVHTLEGIEITNKGIPDKTNSFMVEFRSKSVEPYVYLKEDGLIVSINAEPENVTESKRVIHASETVSENPRRFFSQETLMAGSTAKQAELVARQIFDLRRNRSDILSGEAVNMPPDGNAYNVVMEEINKQEKALTELFSGSVTTEFFTETYQIIPENSNINREVIARFSEKLGPLDPDNLAGEPIYISLIRKTPEVVMQLSERDLQRLESKLSEGIVYNIPGKGDLSIEFGNRTLKSLEVDVVQFGSQDVLAKKMFENNKQPIEVHFYPELGAIKQIIQ